MPETKDIHTAEQILNALIQYCVKYSFQIIGAIVLFAAGWVIAGRLSALVVGVCARKKMDLVLVQFLGGLIKVLTLTIFAVIALDALGINISPFIAAIGACAFGLTLALKGPLSNYGAGVAIIFTRPFTVGNTITTGNHSGVVEDVKLANTVLITCDGERITIPNRQIIGETIVNSLANKIIEGKVGVAYDTDPGKAIEVVTRALENAAGVVQEPKPQVGIDAFGDSALFIGYRYWVPSKTCHVVRYAANLGVYKALKSAGIEIPFQRQDVYLFEDKRLPQKRNKKV